MNKFGVVYNSNFELSVSAGRFTVYFAWSVDVDSCKFL